MYNRLFTSIVASSIWSEPLEVCKVWITLLAMQDKEGYVFASSSGLARIAALPVETVNLCLEKFLAPDKESSDLLRAPEREGRRIEVIDGGWRLFNTKHYNELANADARREQFRDSKRRTRAAKRRDSEGKQGLSTPVHKSPPSEAYSASASEVTQEEREAPALKKKPKDLAEVQAFWIEAGLRGDAEVFWLHYEDRGWKWKSWQRAAKKWSLSEKNQPSYGQPRNLGPATPSRYANVPTKQENN